MKRLLLLAAAVAAPAIAQQTAPRGPSAPTPPAAVDRYHEAARLYVDGQNAPALAAAEEAVRLAPGDQKAAALRDLIKQQQDNQDQQKDQDQQRDQDQQNQDQQDQDQQQQDEQKPDDAGQQNPPNAPPSTGQNPQNTPSDQPQAGDEHMSRDQAERILDAVGGDERQVLRQIRRAPSRARTNEQDW